MSIKVGLEPLHELHVVQRPGLDEFVDVNRLQQEEGIAILGCGERMRSRC